MKKLSWIVVGSSWFWVSPLAAQIVPATPAPTAPVVTPATPSVPGSNASADSPAATAVATATVSNEKFNLRYQLTAGQTFRWSTTHVASTLVRINNEESHDRSTTETVKVWRVDRVEGNGSIVIEQSIEHLVLSQSIGDGDEVRYDSRSTTDVPLRYESIAKTIGVPLTLVTISPDGRILQKEAIYQASQMGMDDVAVPLPSEPAAIGATWHTSTDFVAADENDRNAVVKLRKAYRLESVTDGIATISMRTEVLTPVTDPRIESQLVQDLTAGTIRFDIARGMVISKEMKWDEEVVGFSGPQSFMEFHGRFDEKNLEGTATTQGAPRVNAAATEASSTGSSNFQIRSREAGPILRK